MPSQDGSRFGGSRKLFTCLRLLYIYLTKTPYQPPTTHQSSMTQKLKHGHFLYLPLSLRTTVRLVIRGSLKLNEFFVWPSCKIAWKISDGSDERSITFDYISRLIQLEKAKKLRRSRGPLRRVSTVGSSEQYAGTVSHTLHFPSWIQPGTGQRNTMSSETKTIEDH